MWGSRKSRDLGPREVMVVMKVEIVVMVEQQKVLRSRAQRGDGGELRVRE